MSERQIPCDLTDMWNVKHDTNEPIYEREMEQTGGCQGRELKEGCSGRLGLADTSFIYRMDNNKVLLYSTGNYIQYFVITHNGKECEKYKHICVYLFI